MASNQMKPPTVVNKYKENFDVNIQRGSIWGNPYVLPKGASNEERQECISKYKEYLLGKPELLAEIKNLEGKTLGCSCKPKACHGDVLVELFNMLMPNVEKPKPEPPKSPLDPSYRIKELKKCCANCCNRDVSTSSSEIYCGLDIPPANYTNLPEYYAKEYRKWRAAREVDPNGYCKHWESNNE